MTKPKSVVGTVHFDWRTAQTWAFHCARVSQYVYEVRKVNGQWRAWRTDKRVGDPR